MKIPTLTAAAAAALMSLTACDQNEPTAANFESRPIANTENLAGSPLGEGRIMTPQEVAQMKAMQANTPATPVKAQSIEAAPLAKTAAATCIVDFNQQAALAAMPDHCYNTFATTPYNHTCYNNSNIYMMATPYNLDHFHLGSEAADQCYGTLPKWGHYSNGTYGSCLNQSDAMYWARAASNMNGNTAIAFNAVANGSYKKFNLVAFYVRSGTVRLATYNSGTWKYYGPCTAGQRWYMGSTTTVDQVIFFDSQNNGVFTIDNVEAQILY